jgi:hypothetical protein
MSDETLLEEVLSAHRARSPRGEIIAAPAFADLGPDDRERAYRESLMQRAIEGALHPEGLSTTARAILSRIPESRVR